MKLKKIMIAMAVIMTVSLALFAAGAQEKPAAAADAPLTGKVSLYASITSIEPIMEDFSAKVGVEGEYTRLSTSRFISTVLTEFQANKLMADVIQGPLPILEILKEQGVVKNYKAKAAEGYPDWAKRDGIYLFGIEYVGLIYNTQLVSAEEAPKPMRILPIRSGRSYRQWRTRQPRTHSWLVGLKENVFATEAEWMAFVRGLAANEPMFVAFLRTHARSDRQRRERSASPCPSTFVTIRRSALTIEALPADARSPRRSRSPAAHRNRCAARRSWSTAHDDAMSLLANDVGEYVLTPGVYPPIPGISETEVIPIRELSDEEIQKWGAEFEKIFALK